ncbi:6183_t:CDS:1, partial [Dentiscutata heterogama]
EANLGVNDILSFNLYIELDDLVLNTAHQDAKNTKHNKLNLKIGGSKS